jgi:hypothetical protein
MKRYIVILVLSLTIKLNAQLDYGLSHWWTLNGSTSTLVDTIGSLNLTATGAYSHVAGKNNLGMNLDGTTGKMNFPTSLTSNVSEFTINMFIKPDELVSTNTMYEESYGGYQQVHITQGYFNTRDASTGTTGSRNNDLAMPTLSTSAMQMVTCVYSVKGNYKKIYLNGVESATTSTSIDVLTTERDQSYNQFGGSVDANYYDGIIDEISFFNVAKSATDIAELYNNGSGRFPPLIPSLPTLLDTARYWSTYGTWLSVYNFRKYNSNSPPPPSGNITQSAGGFDSTYILACKQKYAIPECCRNNDQIGYFEKNLTWMNGNNTITYSIETNFNNAFSINSSSGLITISDYTKINGHVSDAVQDTAIVLIVRTTDAVLGYELDTAEIWVKDSTHCVFINKGWTGAHSGSRSEPYTKLSDVSNIPNHLGMGYFFMRGASAYSYEQTNLHHMKNATSHPVIFAAYGAGALPIFGGNNSGMEPIFKMGFHDSTPDQDRYVNRIKNVRFYDLKFQESYGIAIWVATCSEGIGIYNCTFDHTGSNDIENGQFTMGVQNDPRPTYFDYRPLEIINCVFTRSTDSHIKLGAQGPTLVQNCDFGLSVDIGIRFGGYRGSIMKHCIGQTGSTVNEDWNCGVQLRADSLTILDCRIIGNYSNIEALSESNNSPQSLETLRVKNCYLRGALANAIYVRLGDETYEQFTNHIYEDNLITYAVHGFHLESLINSIIRRNIIHNCGTGIYVINHGSKSTSNCQISYNLLYNNSSIDINAASGSGYAYYNNDVIGTIDLSSSSSETVKNNFYITLISAATESNNIDIDNINTSDYFTNYAAHDYTLKSTATSAINTGYNWGQILDILGRVLSGTYDDGCYKY